MEIYKDVKGYEGLYQVSNLGNVKSFKKHNGTNERILKSGIVSSGYPMVVLSNDGLEQKLIHRLVAIAFIPNPHNKRTVNHKNGIKTDNRLVNLEWMHYSENIKHAFRVLGRIQPKIKPVLQFDLDGNFIKEFAGQTMAQQATGVDQRNISACCLGKRKHAGGYKWKLKYKS